MKEKYYIIKADNGYYVEVIFEDTTRRMVFERIEEFREFMTKTLMSELNTLGSINVTTDYF